MAKTKRNPESLDEMKEAKNNEDLASFVNELRGDIENEASNRALWENAVDRLNRLRFGARRKKNHPWPGAANYMIPVIDSKIERIKPSYVNLAYSVSPIVTFEPFGPEDVDPARKREQLFDWRMKTQVKFFQPYCIGIDQILGAQGMTVFRIVWKFSSRRYTVKIDLEDFDEEVLGALYDARVTDDILVRIIQEQYKIDFEYEENEIEVYKAVQKFREGKTEFVLNLYETKQDCPEVKACNVAEDLVVPLETKDLNDARFIDYKYWISKNDLKIAMRDHQYKKFDNNSIDAWAGNSQKERKTKYRNASVESDMIMMHETCCWYDIDGDGIEERCIVTWPDADTTAILRFIELPYDHGQWPYVQVKREIISEWFYATRGFPSLDEDFQQGISTAVNQAIDNGTLVNQPERVARKGAISNPRNRRWLPGEFTEVNGPPSDYELRTNVNISQPVLFQQAQFLKGWSDQRSGQAAQAYTSPTELPGMGQGGKKTKAEIEAISVDRNQAQSLDLIIFQEQMAGVYYQIDSLYYQFGKDEEYINITGKKPLKVSRAEIQGKFNLVPNGKLDNSTPGARLQKKMFAFQIGANNPYVKQYELLNEIFQDIDQRLAALVVKSKEEINQELQEQQLQAIASENENLKKVLGMRKISDDMDIRKEMLLTPIAGRKYAAN